MIEMTDSVKDSLTKVLTNEMFRILMDSYSDDLFLFVRGIVANNESAEEIVSDVFIKIWQKRDTFHEINNIRSFLFILARNESISFLRRKRRIKELSLEEVDEYNLIPFESDGTEFFNQEIIDKINSAIELLPAKCKMAFSLAKINGLKYKEIAEIMEISPLTVKNHIAYALEKICSHIGASHNGNKIKNYNILLLYFFLQRLSKETEL